MGYEDSLKNYDDLFRMVKNIHEGRPARTVDLMSYAVHPCTHFAIGFFLTIVVLWWWSPTFLVDKRTQDIKGVPACGIALASACSLTAIVFIVRRRARRARALKV